VGSTGSNALFLGSVLGLWQSMRKCTTPQAWASLWYACARALEGERGPRLSSSTVALKGRKTVFTRAGPVDATKRMALLKSSLAAPQRQQRRKNCLIYL